MSNNQISFENGDLFEFRTEAEARAFYRGFQYASWSLTNAARRPKRGTSPLRDDANNVAVQRVAPRPDKCTFS